MPGLRNTADERIPRMQESENRTDTSPVIEIISWFSAYVKPPAYSSFTEKMGGTYTLGDDGIYYPDLTVGEGEKPHYGKYGMLRKSYLKEHHGGLYSFLLLSGNLTAHLNEIDDAANAQMELLVPQMMEKEGIDEAMKARDQLAWFGAVTNICNAAEEIVLNALVYA